MPLFENLRGIVGSILQIGSGGPQWKNNASVFEARNATDTGFVRVRGATPIGPNDFVTLAASSTYDSLRFAVALVTTQSVTLIPANAVVVATSVTIQSAYDLGTTIEIGRAGAPALLQASIVNSPQAPDQYLSPQDVAWGAVPLAVVATVSGGPTTGAAVVRVDYVIPRP